MTHYILHNFLFHLISLSNEVSIDAVPYFNFLQLMVSKKQMIEQKQQLYVTKQWFYEAQYELEELQSKMEDKLAQFEDYKIQVYLLYLMDICIIEFFLFYKNFKELCFPDRINKKESSTANLIFQLIKF